MDDLYSEMDEPLVRRWADHRLGLPDGSTTTVTFSVEVEGGCHPYVGDLTVVAYFDPPVDMEVPDYTRRMYGKRPTDWVAMKVEARKYWPIPVDDFGTVIRELCAEASLIGIDQ